MSHGRLILLMLLLLALGRMPPAARGEIAVRLVPETASRFIDEPFTLRLEVESDAPPQPPKLPDVPGLTVTTVRQLTTEPAGRKCVFQIGLIAEREGMLTIPPFAVQAEDERAMTDVLPLPISAPRPASEMSLAITVEPGALRVGQPATVTVRWTSSVPLERCKQLLLEIPLVADARCQVFPLDPPAPEAPPASEAPPAPEAERIGLPVNNLRVMARADVLPDKQRVIEFRYELVPREPCVLRAPPARLAGALLQKRPKAEQTPSYFDNHFFAEPADNEVYERIYLAALSPEIIVRALTEPGRTGHYAEIVGPCELRVSVAPTELVVGQAALLTVSLENLAFGRQIAALPSAAYDGLRPDFQVSAEPIRETSADQARSFTHVVRPLRAGITRVPAVVIQTFDPQSGQYQTLRSAPLPVRVEPDPENVSGAIAPRPDSKPPAALAGIRHNRLNEQTMLPLADVLEFFGRLWWVFLPLAPVVWLALRPLARRWERCRRDPVFARATAALGCFRRLAGRDEETAWRHYLADRLALCAEALTAESVAEALRARRAAEDLIAETRRRFDQRDATDYGRRPAVPLASTRGLVRRLQRATVPLLLVCAAWLPLRARAAESADELFSRAVQLRGDKPDEAQPLFVEAGLQFESDGQFINAGNAWFFAGASGRALANYRAAQRRLPWDRALAESIDFLRANRADAFVGPATPSGQVAAFWKRFCTWATVLRVGLFVAAYLAAWALWIATRLLGWRLRRAVWAAMVGAVLVPLISLAQSSLQPAEGVVIEDAVARLGPGYAYDPAFEQPLHQATEFSWLQTRQGWVRARLPDASEGWLRQSDCLPVP